MSSPFNTFRILKSINPHFYLNCPIKTVGKMENYIALLRGINVGGNRIVKMELLRTLLSDNGFEDVSTYIQSGNLLFKYKNKSQKEASSVITKLIKSEFDLEVPTIITTPQELVDLMELIPTKMKNEYQPNHVFIIFLDKIPENDKIESLAAQDLGKGEYIIIDKYVIFGSNEGFSGSKMNTNFFEKKLHAKGTARNLKTVEKLISLQTL